MALKHVFLLLLVYSSVHFSSSRRCLQSLPGLECDCAWKKKTSQAFCSCLRVKTLDLKNLSQDHDVAKVRAFHLNNCTSTSVLVFPGAFSGLGLLESIVFRNIRHLTLEPRSISLISRAEGGFTLTFSLIRSLSLRENAINIQLPRHHDYGVHVSVRIEHSTLVSLMKYAIVGELQELTMEEVLLKARPWPRAIVFQGSGASLTLKSVSVKKGLSGKWIMGNISHLSIIRSNLRLLPDAFAGVNVVGGGQSQAGIVLFGNNFMMPFLPSHALPSDGYPSLAKNNHIVCSCHNLAWLFELPYNQLKENFKASLNCRNKSHASVLSSCDTNSLSTP